MSAADLHSRVTSLLGGEGGIPEAETLLADLSSEKAALEVERADTHAQSVDVTTTAASAAKLHGKASQLAFEVERLGRQETAVLERLVTIREAELEAAAASEKSAALKQRDELLSDVEYGFPAAVQAIAGLLDRMKANDARLRAAGVSPEREGVEYLARGFSPDCGGKPGRLAVTTRLPHLHDAGGDLAWPRRVPVQMWVPPVVARPDPRPLDAEKPPRFPIDVTPHRLAL